MPNRHSDRERWEVLITQILLAFRPIIFVIGLILLIYAGIALFYNQIIGFITVVLGIYLLWLVFSDQAILQLARLGSWLATGGKN